MLLAVQAIENEDKAAKKDDSKNDDGVSGASIKSRIFTDIADIDEHNKEKRDATESTHVTHNTHEEKLITIVKKVPVPIPVTKHIPYPVEKIVPVPIKVDVIQPYPVYRTVPYPVKEIVKVSEHGMKIRQNLC